MAYWNLLHNVPDPHSKDYEYICDAKGRTHFAFSTRTQHMQGFNSYNYGIIPDSFYVSRVLKVYGNMPSAPSSMLRIVLVYDSVYGVQLGVVWLLTLALLISNPLNMNDKTANQLLVPTNIWLTCLIDLLRTGRCRVRQHSQIPGVQNEWGGRRRAWKRSGLRQL
jgi:hypothetical protein